MYVFEYLRFNFKTQDSYEIANYSSNYNSEMKCGSWSIWKLGKNLNTFQIFKRKVPLHNKVR